MHLRGHQAARKINNAATGPVNHFGNQEELELYVEKQLNQAEEVANEQIPFNKCAAPSNPRTDP